MQKNLYALKRDIVEAGRRVYERGYVASNDGNISARVDQKRVIITPTGVSKGFMSPEDLVLVDMEGNILDGRKRPSLTRRAVFRLSSVCSIQPEEALSCRNSFPVTLVS